VNGGLENPLGWGRTVKTLSYSPGRASRPRLFLVVARSLVEKETGSTFSSVWPTTFFPVRDDNATHMHTWYLAR
jgi:hypothetical protein